MINITFPDGSVRQYESGVSAFDIANSISPRLAADVLAATVYDTFQGAFKELLLPAYNKSDHALETCPA